MVEKIKIRVIDTDGRFEADPTIPVNMTIRGFIKSMGKKFNLLPEGPIKIGKLKGQFRYYQAINKRTGEVLYRSEQRREDQEKTFADYDIKDGDTIKIYELGVD